MKVKIYWDDLNQDAQRRLKDIYHENIELAPLAIFEVENSELNQAGIDYTQEPDE